MDVLECQGAQSIGLSNHKLKSAPTNEKLENKCNGLLLRPIYGITFSSAG